MVRHVVGQVGDGEGVDNLVDLLRAVQWRDFGGGEVVAVLVVGADLVAVWVVDRGRVLGHRDEVGVLGDVDAFVHLGLTGVLGSGVLELELGAVVAVLRGRHNVGAGQRGVDGAGFGLHVRLLRGLVVAVLDGLDHVGAPQLDAVGADVADAVVGLHSRNYLGCDGGTCARVLAGERVNRDDVPTASIVAVRCDDLVPRMAEQA